MKKRKLKPAALSVLLAVIYLFGLPLGACVTGAYPMYRQKEVSTVHARLIAQEYAEGVGETIETLTSRNSFILIYDADGNFLRCVTLSHVGLSEKFRTALETHLPSILSGKEVFALSPSYGSQRFKFKTITGVPIRNDGTVTGAVFLVKNLMDLPETITGYFIYFTIFYWLSACFILFNARRKRKLEELRQNYIANVTHELKTPISSIKALAETLCDGVEPDPDKQRVYYGMILQAANRQDRMVRNILELSKLQSGGIDFTKTETHAAAVLEPVLGKYAALCDCMGVSLHISEGISRLPPLYTNTACIKQLMEILLDNAIKFVKEGGSIWVGADSGKNHVTLCVRDNGIGIAKKDLPHVFKRFYKSSHERNAGGSGLGLAIAEEITAGMKEHIWAESEPGKGAAFFFTIHLK